MTNKEKYRDLCKKEKSIPIFSKDWWMDAVCGENNWDVLSVEKGGQIVASLPYYLRKRGKIRFVTQPPLTQTNGIWIKYPPNQKYCKKLSYENKVMTEIINQLDELNLDYYNQNFYYSITNWLPFYWKGFKQTTRYTYVIEDLEYIESVFLNFRKSRREDIKKVEKIISIVDNFTLKDFYEMNKLTFKRQNLNIPYSFELINKIDVACKKNKCRKMFFAVDKKNKVHAAMYCIYDDISVYLIMSGADPKLRHKNAESLIIFEAIKYASKNNLKLDFEGSMIQGVEQVNRSFGAIQKPYFNISKINSKVLQLLNLFVENSIFLKNIVKKFIE
jgi:lipid II:glycine glycyltransferase (peptidoglycan interpeptide bridge formation enzyme)